MSVNQGFDFFIQWHLTERCNLRCTHCYQSDRKTKELTFPEIKKVIGDVSDMLKYWSDHYGITFSPSMNVTGGEPFLRRDIFEILEEIVQQGFDTYLLSNGTMVDGGKARVLSEMNVKGVQVSLEGPEEVHEMIRGKGSFSSSLKGVEHLLNAKIPVTLNVTLSALNADYFMDMVMLASSCGVQRLGFSRLVPSGRGIGLLDSMLKKERVKELYEAIFSMNKDGLDIVTGDPVASQMRTLCDEDAIDSIPNGGCAAGVSGLTFLPDGTIMPCRRLNLLIGNVLKDSLREVWATSKVLNLLRNKAKYKGKCGVCKRWAHCRGCRAIAYAYAQSQGKDDFLAEDPQCFIESAE